jgi:hypothetical protein
MKRLRVVGAIALLFVVVTLAHVLDVDIWDEGER